MNNQVADSLQIEFNDNSMLSSLFGVYDSNIQLLEKMKEFDLKQLSESLYRAAETWVPNTLGNSSLDNPNFVTGTFSLRSPARTVGKYKHQLVSPEDTSRLGMAFFRTNAYVSTTMLVSTLIAVLIS